jgi:hypothetical protein
MSRSRRRRSDLPHRVAREQVDKVAVDHSGLHLGVAGRDWPRQRDRLTESPDRVGLLGPRCGDITQLRGELDRRSCCVLRRRDQSELRAGRIDNSGDPARGNGLRLGELQLASPQPTRKSAVVEGKASGPMGAVRATTYARETLNSDAQTREGRHAQRTRQDRHPEKSSPASTPSSSSSSRALVRYVHYSLMVFGHARIPIIGWMRNRPQRA